VVLKIYPAQSFAISAEKNIKFLVEHQCPQCGAPITLFETDKLVLCEFCRVKSYLKANGFFMYCLPSFAPPDKKLVYFPYWRFKGMLFACADRKINHRFIDLTHQAISSLYFPISTGLRTQSLKLKYITPETQGLFLKPVISLNNVLKIFKNRFVHTLSKPIWHRAHIGETISLIYSPFYVEKKVYDAVINQPVSANLPDNFDLSGFNSQTTKGTIKFLPTLCPDCGWDLEGERDSLVLSCKNCKTSWQASKDSFKKINTAHLKSKGENILYLPFWRISSKIDGIKLNSYANLVKIANLAKAPQKEWEKKPFWFWCPAFKIRPKSFLRLARSASVSLLPEKLISGMPVGSFNPTNLEVQEAIESLKLILADFGAPRQPLWEKLSKIDIIAKKYLLVYLPFKEGHHDFVQPLLNVAINKNQLALAKNL